MLGTNLSGAIIGVKSVNRHHLLAALLLTPTVAFQPHSSALAQDKKPSAKNPSAWAQVCFQNKSKKLLGCRLIQRVFVRKGNRRALLMATHVRHPVGAEPSLALTLPIDISLNTPVVVSVFDKGKKAAKTKLNAEMEACNQKGCTATAKLDSKWRAALKSGHRMTVAFKNSNQKPIQIALTLVGYAKAAGEAEKRVAAAAKK